MIPDEVPVGELGVLGVVVLDVDEVAINFFAEVVSYFFEYLADEKAAFEAIGVIGGEGDFSFVVDLS